MKSRYAKRTQRYFLGQRNRLWANRKESLKERFERGALKKLRGRIAFVSKKNVTGPSTMTKSEVHPVQEKRQVSVREGPGEPAYKLAVEMEVITFKRIGPLELAYAKHNRNRNLLPHGKSLAVLREEESGEGDSCTVVATGLSPARRNPIKAASHRGEPERQSASDSSRRHWPCSASISA
jgi:hypothetical protein